MLIIQSGLQCLRHLSDGTFEIAKDGEKIEGPFIKLESIVNRLAQLEKLYDDTIEDWQFYFTHEGNISVKNSKKNRNHDSYLIQNKLGHGIDPRDIEKDLEKSNILITPMALFDCPHSWDECDSVLKNMKVFLPEIKKYLTKFCTTFVKNAAALNFNPYKN